MSDMTFLRLINFYFIILWAELLQNYIYHAAYGNKHNAKFKVFVKFTTDF